MTLRASPLSIIHYFSIIEVTALDVLFLTTYTDAASVLAHNQSYSMKLRKTKKQQTTKQRRDSKRFRIRGAIPVLDVEHARRADEDGHAGQDRLYDDGEAIGVEDAKVAVLGAHDEAAGRVLVLALLVERLHGGDGGRERGQLVPRVDEELDPRLRVVRPEEVDGLICYQGATVS